MVVLKVGPKAWKLAASSAAQMVAWMAMTRVLLLVDEKAAMKGA